MIKGAHVTIGSFSYFTTLPLQLVLPIKFIFCFIKFHEVNTYGLVDFRLLKCGNLEKEIHNDQHHQLTPGFWELSSVAVKHHCSPEYVSIKKSRNSRHCVIKRDIFLSDV